MKKIISSLLVIVILFNFILCNSSYADEENDKFEGQSSIKEDTIKPSEQEEIISEGKTTDGSGNVISIVWDVMGAIFGAIAGVLVMVINVFPMLIQVAMMIAADSKEIFTIEKAVFNEFGIFNINYFNFEKSYTIGTGDNEKTIEVDSKIVLNLRNSVAKFFVIMRLIAIAASLLTLIYVGIRMAISATSSEKAKYKQMLISWVESIIILFLLQYIISFVINLGELFGDIVYDMKCSLDSSGEVGFETQTMDTIYSSMMITSGWTYVLYSVVFWFLIYVQIKFYFSYFRRTIVVGFLILISPLVTITYPIDKIGDGKAQAFTVWCTELAMNVFIQPVHAMIYLVFIYTAGEIAKQSILVALVFLLSLTKVEKIILYLFNLRNVASLKPVDDEKTKI